MSGRTVSSETDETVSETVGETLAGNPRQPFRANQVKRMKRLMKRLTPQMSPGSAEGISPAWDTQQLTVSLKRFIRFK